LVNALPVIYVDESGDLGFGTSSSPIFVISAVVFADSKTPNKLVKQFRARKLSAIGTTELKWNKSSDEVREEVIRRVGQEDVDIGYAAILWKNRVSARLQNSKTQLYNYLCYQVIRWLANRRRGYTCEVVLDRSKYGFAEADINRYVESNGYKMVVTEWEGQIVLVPSRLNVKLQHKDSGEEAGLQIADFVAGAIFHYWKNGQDDKYLRHIRRRICGAYHFPRTGR
jgi:hypothetical protein